MASKMHLRPLGALPAVRSKAVVMLLLIYWLLPSYVFFLCLFLFCHGVFSVLDRTAAEAMGVRGSGDFI